MKELELISLYYYLCECNDKLLWAYNQRFSPNTAPINEKLTDAELLTIYFYCRRYENKHSKSEIYDYAKRYLSSWFPDLSAYANFNTRLNNLGPSLPYLVEYLLEEMQIIENQHINPEISTIDSLPIMLCSGKRQGKVAPELSEKSYCATKGIYYFGVKVHAIAFHRQGKLPIPEYLLLTSAAENDLEAVRHVLPQLQNRTFFADKAYSDTQTNDILAQNCNSRIYTPIKLIKGESGSIRQFKKAADDLFSTAVSRIRQPIESLFNWIIQKTNIQNASKVRSTKGLLLHTYGAMAAALLFWIF
jgi:Transposase DDE domain